MRWEIFEQVVDMALDGRITESVTVAAVLKAEVPRARGELVLR